jgi:hypothetical protein
MSENFVKSSSSHHEWDEPAFLQSDQKLTFRETMQRHGKALLLC